MAYVYDNTLSHGDTHLYPPLVSNVYDIRSLLDQDPEIQ